MGHWPLTHCATVRVNTKPPARRWHPCPGHGTLSATKMGVGEPQVTTEASTSRSFAGRATLCIGAVCDMPALQTRTASKDRAVGTNLEPISHSSSPDSPLPHWACLESLAYDSTSLPPSRVLPRVPRSGGFVSLSGDVPCRSLPRCASPRTSCQCAFAIRENEEHDRTCEMHVCIVHPSGNVVAAT